MNDVASISFWRWLAKGSGGKPGYSRLINRWLFLHIGMGVLLAWLVQVDLQTAANTVLLPLVGILIGLCFAWAGNAQALLQADEIAEMSRHHEGGFAEYVFTYQAAILAILVAVVAWALAGFGIFDTTWPTTERRRFYFCLETFLFALSSLTLRECWHVVLGAQWMLLVQHKVNLAKKTGKK